MKIKIPTVAALFAAFSVSTIASLAQFPGSATYSIETTQYRPTDVQLRRGETKLLRWRFLQDGAALTIPETATVTLNYKAPGATGGYYVATGTVYNTTGGTVQVVWYSALNPTNRVSDYDVTVSTLTATLCRAFGRLNLDTQVASGIATGNPGVVGLIDWATVQNSNIGSAPFISTMATGGVTRIDDSADVLNSGDGTGVQTLTLADARTNQIAKGETAFGWGNHAGLYAAIVHSQAWATVTGTPATLSGYGITNAVSNNDVRVVNALTNAGAFASSGLLITINGTAGTLNSNLNFTVPTNTVIANAVTNGGATVNGQAISNGAAITITAGGNVASVNGYTGVVVLTAGDVGTYGTNEQGNLQLSNHKIEGVSEIGGVGAGITLNPVGGTIYASGNIEASAPNLSVAGFDFNGNGAAITNINGANIQPGTITSNQMNATADAAYRNPSVTYCNSGTGCTLSASALYAAWTVTLTGNWTVAISPAMTPGQQWDIEVAHSTSNQVITWPANVKAQKTGVSLSDTNTTGFTDWYTLKCRGTNSTTALATNLFKFTGIQ